MNRYLNILYDYSSISRFFKKRKLKRFFKKNPIISGVDLKEIIEFWSAIERSCLQYYTNFAPSDNNKLTIKIDSPMESTISFEVLGEGRQSTGILSVTNNFGSHIRIDDIIERRYTDKTLEQMDPDRIHLLRRLSVLLYSNTFDMLTKLEKGSSYNDRSEPKRNSD